MNSLKLASFAVDLFKQNYITKVELEDFKAKERALEKLHNFKISINIKREKLELAKLKNIEKIIDLSQTIIQNIKCLPTKCSGSLIDRKTKMLNIVEKFIAISTQEIMSNYSGFLSISTKKQFLQITDTKE